MVSLAPSSRRGRLLSWLRAAQKHDLFGSLRHDDELATLVRAVSARHDRPYTVLMNSLIGTPTNMDEKVARGIWLEAVEHRRVLARQLGRPVLLRVAALDLLWLRPRGERIGRPRVVSTQVLSALEGVLSRDELTGAASREFFETVLTFALRQRRSKPLIVGYLDIDGFKQVNDTQGHQRGDELLAAVGRLWPTVSRRGDVLARLGGDEFATLFVECSLDHARAIVARLNAALKREAPDVSIGVSAGFAAAGAKDDVRSILGRADRAMYARRKQARGAPTRSATETRSPPARRRPPATPPPPPPERRQVIVYATRYASRFIALQADLARLGVLLLPAASMDALRTLVRLASPLAVLADTMFPPRGGATVLEDLGPKPSPLPVLVVPASWSAKVAARVQTLSFPYSAKDIDRLAKQLKVRPVRAFSPVSSAEEATALMATINRLVTRSGGEKVGDEPVRLEVDFVRRLLGS